MKKHIILIISIFLLSMSAFAQQDEQVTVEGKFRPKVNKVNKLQLNPETPIPTYAFPSSEVNPKEAKQKFDLSLDKISPTAFAAKKDKLVTPTKNFLVAGIGTRLSPLFLYKHNSMLAPNIGLGLGLKHNSSWVNIKNYAPSSYMNNAFDSDVTFNTGDVLLDFGLLYKNDMYHYYGVNTSEVQLTDKQVEELCPRQSYNTIGVRLVLSPNKETLGKLNQTGGLSYRYTFDRFGCSDHWVKANYGLVYPVRLWGKENHPQVFSLDATFDYDSYGVYDTLHNQGLFALTPSFEMSNDYFRLHLGARVDAAAPRGEEESYFIVRPDVNGSLYVLNRKLEFYAGVNGGRKLLTYSEIVEENPFVWQLPGMQHQDVKLGVEAGVRTSLIDNVDLHLGVRYRHTDNDPLYKTYDYDIDYTQSDIIFNKFTIVYDETRTVSVLGDVRVKMNSFTADLGMAYNNCKPTNESYAWYRPTVESKLKMTYDFNEKIAFNASLLFQGGRFAQVYEFGDQGLTYSTQKLKDVFDLSFGADYKLNDQITAFALLDNVACQKYQLYYNYPVTGIQLYAGVKLKF